MHLQRPKTRSTDMLHPGSQKSECQNCAVSTDKQSFKIKEQFYLYCNDLLNSDTERVSRKISPAMLYGHYHSSLWSSKWLPVLIFQCLVLFDIFGNVG